MIKRTEYYDYITPDGVTVPLHVPAAVGRWVISATGEGLPPINYDATQGPGQNGATVRAFTLGPRVVQLLIRQQFCDRLGYWLGRSDLLDAIRPNRQYLQGATVPGILRKTRTDGSRRSLSAVITQGPNFEGSRLGFWDEFAFQEVLRFICYDPTAFDPTVKSQTFTPDPDLVFPITFPITFGELRGIWAVQYAGTWPAFPTITLTGPMTAPRMENLTTGGVIQLAYTIPAGDTVTVSLTYGAKTVTDQNGVNLVGTVTSDSDLAFFHLAPPPEAPGGLNSVKISATGIDTTSNAVLSWNDRSLGF